MSHLVKNKYATPNTLVILIPRVILYNWM